MEKLLELAVRAAESSSPRPLSVTTEDDSYSINLSYDETEWCERNSSPTIGVLNALFTLFGTIIGIFLIVIIRKNNTLREDKYLFLNHMFGSSFALLIIIGILYSKEALDPCWRVGPFMCKVIHVIKTILTNNTTNFLVVMAIEQLNRYREAYTTVFNSSHTRKNIVAGSVWVISAIFSIPELFLARILKFDFEGIVSICNVFHLHGHQRFVLAAKIIFVEYIIPFVVLAVLVIAIGVYVGIANSRYSSWGTGASNEPQLPKNFHHPKYFLLVAVLSAIFLVGYFPRYSFELATFLDDLIHAKNLREFWWQLDTVSTLFAIIPPAMTPLCIMLLSWQHRTVILIIYQCFTVDTSIWQQKDVIVEEPFPVSIDENAKETERYEQLS